MTYWFSRATLFQTSSLSLSYVELVNPAIRKLGFAYPTEPFYTLLFRFPDMRDKLLQVYIQVLLSFSLFLKQTDSTRYLGRGFPSRRVFRSKFRTRFFSHWRLHHLCRFRDYFCRFVLSGHPVERRGQDERDVGENRELERDGEATIAREKPIQWGTALLAFQNGIYRK